MSERVHSVHLTLPALASIRAWSSLVGGAWFYQNQASQSERERGWRSRAFQLSRGLQALPSRKTHVILVSSRLRSGFLYVRISGKSDTSGLELNVIINGWIPVEKDFVWYYTSLLGNWITPGRLRHQRLWILEDQPAIALWQPRRGPGQTFTL